MKKLNINKIHIEYNHKTKKYYRLIQGKDTIWGYDWCMEISKQTALNWVKKGAQLREWNKDWDDWKGYDNE